MTSVSIIVNGASQLGFMAVVLGRRESIILSYGLSKG